MSRAGAASGRKDGRGRAWPAGALTRRSALALTVLPLVLALAPARAQEPTPILTVSRQRLLNDTAYARALVEAEQRMTAELQSRVDETKRTLASREQELARLRGTLPRDEFEALTNAFDRRVRRERREAQRQAAVLQSAFRNERVKLLEILDAFLERVRAERGASVILNQDEAIASDPALDITDEVLARFDQAAPPPEIPKLEAILANAPEPPETEE